MRFNRLGQKSISSLDTLYEINYKREAKGLKPIRHTNLRRHILQLFSDKYPLKWSTNDRKHSVPHYVLDEVDAFKLAVTLEIDFAVDLFNRTLLPAQ